MYELAIHNYGRATPASMLGDKIIDEVRACLCSWRGVKSTDENRLLVNFWHLSPRIFRP